MLPYYILMTMTAIASIVYFMQINNGNRNSLMKQKDRTVIVFFGIWLILLCCRATSCGIDLWVYKQFFQDFSEYEISREIINELNATFETEKGYILYNLIIHLITDEFQWFIVITSFICVVPLAYFYYKESDNQFISIMIFLMFGLFSMYFSGLRQSLAMTMIIPAYYACRKKKMVWFIIFCVIAIYFHKSAFVMFAMYPAYRTKLSKYHLFILLPLMALFYVFNENIFKYLGGFTDYEVGTTSTNAFGVLALLLIFTIYSFVLVPRNSEIENINNKIDDIEDFIGLRNVLVLATFMQMFAPINFIAMRMNYYFLLIVPVAVSKVAPRASEQFKRLGKWAVIIMAIFFFARYMVNAAPGDQLQIYPYKTFWSA